MAGVQKFLSLPNTYKSWDALKADLVSLEKKEAKGVEALGRLLKTHDRWEVIHLPLKPLQSLLEKDEHFTEKYFTEEVLPWLAAKALQVQDMFAATDYKIRNLYAGISGEVDLSRLQVCCLLSLAFFNAFEPVEGCYQQFTFAGWLSFVYASQISKIKCLLYYFERIRFAERDKNHEFLSMRITITRKGLKLKGDHSSWAECSQPLALFQSLPVGLIEGADGCLQVDFANAYIGGGVLGMGNVQEEIRFVINPECLVAILFCEEMEDTESILITGAEQYSSYSGYGNQFRCKGPHTDTNGTDQKNRRNVSIVAIDATCFISSSSSVQYQQKNILRELNKACCGFEHSIPSDKSESELVAVATGNWGCGAFCGDRKMKTLIQWMAASRVGRNVKYFTFNDAKFSKEQEKVMKALVDQGLTVGELYQKIVADQHRRDIFKYFSQ